MIPIEQCYGVITIYRDTEDFFLILQNPDDKSLWGFPKGHHEGNETPKETALRELREETGITQVELLDLPLIHEEYKVTRNGEKDSCLKMNDYFVGVVKDKTVIIQENEVSDYKWATYKEAFEIFTYTGRSEKLQKAKEYLNEHESTK